MADATASLTFPEVNQGSLSVYVHPSTNITNANFVGLGSVTLYDSFNGAGASASFALNDYGYTLGHPAATAWDATWWAGGGYTTGTANFVPGEWYKVTFSWDVNTDEISVAVLGAGVNGTYSEPLWGHIPTKVSLAGGGMIGGHTTFDDLTLPAAVPEPTALLLTALPLAFIVRRMRRA